MNRVDEVYDALLTRALLGTDRAPGGAAPAPAVAPGEDDALGAALRELSAGEGDEALLRAAAAVSLYRQAGAVAPRSGQPLPAPAAAEERPACPPGAAAFLGRVLAGENEAALPEWLGLARRHGVLAPARYLPDLLERSRVDAGLREAVVEVAGHRGAWLAGLNPDWAFARSGATGPAGASVGDAQEEAWQTGTKDERAAALRRVRAADPAKGREMLQAGWAGEPPDERAAFAAALEVGLSMADEPFLEAALDDKRKEVRRTAADLLARLPESRLRQRMLARVGPLVRIVGRGKKVEIDADLPGACDKGMARDGVEPRPPHGVGEKQWWLRQMVGPIPPGHWSKGAGAAPADLVAAAARSEWRDALLEGWALAAALFGDRDWAAELLKVRHVRDATTRQLFAALDEAGREALLLGELSSAKRQLFDDETVGRLELCRHAWSPELTRLFVERLKEAITGKDPRHAAAWAFRQLVQPLGCFMSPALADEAAAALTGEAYTGSFWQEPLAKAVATLRFRADMGRAFPGSRQ